MAPTCAPTVSEPTTALGWKAGEKTILKTRAREQGKNSSGWASGSSSTWPSDNPEVGLSGGAFAETLNLGVLARIDQDNHLSSLSLSPNCQHFLPVKSQRGYQMKVQFKIWVSLTISGLVDISLTQWAGRQLFSPSNRKEKSVALRESKDEYS